MFSAGGNDDLRGLVGDVVVALEFVRDRLAQFGNAAAGSVFGEAFVERFDGGFLDVERGIEIRLARAETDHVLSLGFHLLGLRIDGQSERWSERRGAARDFIVHKTAERDNGEGGAKQVAFGSKVES